MADEAKGKGRKSTWWMWLAMLLILPVLYALSVGPMAWAVNKTGVGRRIYQVVYDPLFRACSDDPLYGALQRYTDIFVTQGAGGSGP